MRQPIVRIMRQCGLSVLEAFRERDKRDRGENPLMFEEEEEDERTEKENIKER